MSSAPTLYAQQCASCHGAEGRGDGPAGWALDPKPTNFHDPGRQSRRSVQSLYATISQGVDGTAMAAFGSLPDADRWALAFHVSGFQFSATDHESGKSAWNRGEGRERIPDMRALVLATPDSMSSALGDTGRLVLAYLRSQPGLFATSEKASPSNTHAPSLPGALRRTGKETKARPMTTPSVPTSRGSNSQRQPSIASITTCGADWKRR